ncbi:MAG: hypothetical protein ABH883_02510, partial [Candidatus Omnitrophota bacterium]
WVRFGAFKTEQIERAIAKLEIADRALEEKYSDFSVNIGEKRTRFLGRTRITMLSKGLWKDKMKDIEEQIKNKICPEKALEDFLDREIGKAEMAGARKDNIMDNLNRAVSYVENLAASEEEGEVRSGLEEMALEMRKRITSGKAFFFNARVDGQDNYLLGFNAGGTTGLAVEFIEWLGRRNKIKELTAYIFRETYGRTGIEIYDEDAEYEARARRNAVYSKFFKEGGLSNEVDNFIKGSNDPENGEEAVSPAGRGKAGTDPEREKRIIGSGAAVYFTGRDVKVLAGYVDAPHLKNSMESAVNNFNSKIKKNFGQEEDNNQIRVFSIFDDRQADPEDNTRKTLISVMEEFLRVYRDMSQEARLVMYAPQSLIGETPEITAKASLIKCISGAEDYLKKSGLGPENMESVIAGIRDERVTIIRDRYSDCVAGSGKIQLPDIASRFICARHIAAFFQMENTEKRKGIMDEILRLLSEISGAGSSGTIEGYMKNTGKPDLEKVLDRLVIDINPLNYEMLREYHEFMDRVATSL